MNDEKKVAYIFTDKVTGIKKAGLLFKSENGYDLFRVIDVEEVSVPNPDGTNPASETETYTISRVEDYKGVLPTWEIN